MAVVDRSSASAKMASEGVVREREVVVVVVGLSIHRPHQDHLTAVWRTFGSGRGCSRWGSLDRPPLDAFDRFLFLHPHFRRSQSCG